MGPDRADQNRGNHFPDPSVSYQVVHYISQCFQDAAFAFMTLLDRDRMEDDKRTATKPSLRCLNTLLTF